MQPASVRASDAEFNVGFALAAAQTLPPGVYVAMNGMIFDPATTEKDRAAGRFRSATNRE
jgi:L-asparaginase